MAETKMQPLDISTAPLTGTTLIEASAGTGKTWAICGLVLRLIVERGLPIQHILVVTFTKAASAELHERIRDRIQDRLREALAQNEEVVVKNRLEAALAAFDEAAIFTIHGYCQRALGDAPLTAGQPFELSLVDDQNLCREVSTNFWRQSVATLSDPLLATYVAKKLSPADLAAQLRRRIQKPLAQYRWPKGLDFPTHDASSLPALYAAARWTWQQSGEDGLQLLVAAAAEKTINGGMYKAPVLTEGAQAWSAWFASDKLPDDLPPSLCERWCTSVLERKKNKGKTPPSHAVFDAIDTLWSALDARQQALEWARLKLLREFLENAPAELHKRKRARRLASFDDLLSNLHQALSAKTGKALAENLATRFPVALIDEFQDTDPLQFDIFRRIYQSEPTGNDLQEPENARALFLVGDPKQAIYSFRQADLHTYLQARETADRCFYLPNNQRSSRELIEAVNALFSAHDLPFMLPGLDFKSIGMGEKPRGTLIDLRVSEGERTSSPLQGWQLPVQEPLPKSVAMTLAAEACAQKMADLLAGNVHLQAADGANRPLLASDLAVLVRTNKQGQLMKRALAKVGLAAAELATGSVFASTEAADLETLLIALAEPGRPERLRAALATPLLGLDALDLWQLSGHDQTIWAQRFQQSQQCWLRQGLAVALLRLLTGWEISQRLLSIPEGERKLTNLLHVIELAHEFEQSTGGINPAALLRWLAAQRAEPFAAGESAQLRLESDEKLVRIVTIHRSKGLEYPVVFCPFVWEGPSTPRSSLEGLEYPLPKEGGSREGASKVARCVDFRSDEEPDLATGKESAAVENAAEMLRLLYVALTRAVHRCYLVLGPYVTGKASLKNSQQALINWLAAGHGNPSAWVADGGDWASIQQAWEALTIKHPEIALSALPTTPLQFSVTPVSPTAQPARSIRPLPERPPPLHPTWRLDSFTGLLRGAQAVAQTEVPVADHDAIALASELHTAPSLDDILMFERGARAGVCIHAVFENADFSAPETWPAAITNALQTQAHKHSNTSDDLSSARLHHMLHDVLNTPLPTGDGNSFVLSHVGQRERITELEFSLPVHHLSAESLWAVCQRHNVPVPRLAFHDLAGYLRGFIDLVFRVRRSEEPCREPVYYLLDWKSNYLGDHPDDYAEDALRATMVSHGYFLQALIYSVALHRHLRTTLANYDPEQHFGGAYYLFVRGVRADWQGAGVVHWRPTLALLDELDFWLNEHADAN